MDKLNIYLADGTYEGSIIMTSTASKFLAVRVKREDAAMYANELDNPGVYMLLIGDDTVYVGQSGLDTIRGRIEKTHSGTIDESWHTVLGFSYTDKNISSNELLFIENAICEFAHAHYPHCATTSPSKTNCNQTYRIQHYHLNSVQIHACNQYVKDIQYYIGVFVPTVFGQPIPEKAPTAAPSPVPVSETALFYYKNAKRGIYGRAEIEIHSGHTGKRKTILKAGSQISVDVSDKFSQSTGVIKLRKSMEAEGKLVNRILQVDVPFTSQSSAGQFLIGTSCNGNSTWKTVDGDILLSEIME